MAFFLNDKLFSNYTDHIFNTDPPGVLDCLYLKYPGGISIRLTVLKYTYVKQFSQSLNWSLDLYKKEKIGIIEVAVNDRIVKVVK